MQYLSPAEYVIHIFGGVRAAARIIGRNPASVSKWKEPKANRGCNGEIPRGARKTILLLAKDMGLDITSTDLDFGRTIEKAAK